MRSRNVRLGGTPAINTTTTTATGGTKWYQSIPWDTVIKTTGDVINQNTGNNTGGNTNYNNGPMLNQNTQASNNAGAFNFNLNDPRTIGMVAVAGVLVYTLLQD